jgi:hypothetical protein
MSDNHYFLQSSDRERCNRQCSSAEYACDRGNYCTAWQNACYAKCEVLIDGNGSFLGSSDKERCRSNCISNYHCF